MPMNESFGDYVLLKRLAMGGQSEVFLALRQGDHGFYRPVVLKALPATQSEDVRFLELFYQEAFLCARFSHPHLISVHDVRLVDGEHVMIMDYVQGQTVADIAQRGFQRGEPTALLHTVQIIADACDALDHVHDFRDADGSAFQIVHCDVSPQNLMVTYEGKTLLFDFGIAHVLGRDDGAPTTPAGGKYSYMSPEQCLGQKVDLRSDLFSLGIILYELATGTRLFRRDSTPEVIRALTEDPIEAPSRVNGDIPVFLERCIMKALERDPNARYQSARQLREDLLDFLKLHGSGNMRAELGEYVGQLFARERGEVAELLRQGAASMPRRSSEEKTSEMPPSPVRDFEKELHLERERTRRRIAAMDGQLAKIQRKQGLLTTVLVFVCTVAVGLGFYVYQVTDGFARPPGPPSVASDVEEPAGSPTASESLLDGLGER